MRSIFLAFFVCYAVASAPQASAQIAVDGFSEGRIKDCDTFADFKIEPVGTECFVRFENGVIRGHFKISEFMTKNGQKNKGIEIVGTDLIFDTTIIRNVSYRGAAQLCWEKGLKLPSGYPTYRNGEWDYPNKDSDFAVADGHGIREIFGTKMKYQFFWSSSGVSADLVNSFVFSGNDGEIYYFNNSHYWWHYPASAICVHGSSN